MHPGRGNDDLVDPSNTELQFNDETMKQNHCAQAVNEHLESPFDLRTQ
jgi:hypothetical protein